MAHGDFQRRNLVMELDSCSLPNMVDFAQKTAAVSFSAKFTSRKGIIKSP